jgi:Flp pilus assembly protein TadG
MRRLLKDRLESSSRGQALVETGLIISLILFMALATFDLGRGIAAHIALREATQEGALYAGYLLYDPDEGLTIDDVEARVRESSTVEAVMEADVARTGCEVAPGYLTIESTYDLPVISPLGQLVFGSTFELSVEIDAINLNEACS